MNLVKSLLLGTAAGFVAVAGAQAADLPVKAKPVQYVKICDLYGVGFYYIPGTDTCIKLGGFVRAEWLWNAGGSFYPYPYFTGANGRNTRESTYLNSRARAVLTLDTRTQTEYGTLRSYLAAGWQWTTGDGPSVGSGATTYFYRAFIQFAGFTFGKSTSFFDHFITPAYSFQTNIFNSDTGGYGVNLAAYTWQFGNGWSATISAEENFQRRRGILDENVALFPLSGTPPVDDAGQTAPDIVANIRVDQAWGAAQIMGAAHYLKPQWLGANVVGNPTVEDDWGWAAGAGLTINLPWAKGDSFSVQGTYCDGAMGYCWAPNTGFTRYSNNDSLGVGWVSDAVYGVNAVTGVLQGIEKTQGWSVYAGLEHWWTPSVRSSVHGGYATVDYGNNATALICSFGPAAVVTPAIISNCAPDFHMWQVGTRTIWNPVRNLDIGVEVLYTKLDTAFAGPAIIGANGSRPASATAIFDDQDVVSVVFRVQRNFWP